MNKHWTPLNTIMYCDEFTFQSQENGYFNEDLCPILKAILYISTSLADPGGVSGVCPPKGPNSLIFTSVALTHLPMGLMSPTGNPGSANSHEHDLSDRIKHSKTPLKRVPFWAGTPVLRAVCSKMMSSLPSWKWDPLEKPTLLHGHFRVKLLVPFHEEFHCTE